jgi:hypothetical protein
MVKLSAQDYADTFGIDQPTAYVQLREAAESIFNKYIRTVEQTRRGEKERKYRWVSGNTYHHGEGWVGINFAPEVAPFLLGLRKEFTMYKLKHTAALRSVYSWRLMEMFAQYRDTGLVRDQFRRILSRDGGAAELPEGFRPAKAPGDRSGRCRAHWQGRLADRVETDEERWTQGDRARIHVPAEPPIVSTLTASAHA